MTENCITWKKVIQKLSELKDFYWKEAEKYDVFPLDDRSIASKVKGLLKSISNQGPIQRVVYRFDTRFHPSAVPAIKNKAVETQPYPQLIVCI